MEEKKVSPINKYDHNSTKDSIDDAIIDVITKLDTQRQRLPSIQNIHYTQNHNWARNGRFPISRIQKRQGRRWKTAHHYVPHHRILYVSGTLHALRGIR